MYKIDPIDPKSYEKIKNTVVVEPNENSKLNKQIKKSKDFQKTIADNYDKIKDNNGNNNFSMEFKKGYFGDKRGLFATLHNIDLNNIKINPDGSLATIYSDGYDFEKMNKEGNNPYKNVFVDINNNAYQQQEKGKLQRSILSGKVYLTKEELEEILKKYYNK